MKDYPCYDCPTRATGCHSTCATYKTVKAQDDAQRDARYRRTQERGMMIEYTHKAIRRMRGHK